MSEVFSQLDAHETLPAINYAAGRVRQGRLGVGWATRQRIAAVPAALEASLEIVEIDAACERLEAAGGSGSQTVRASETDALFARATIDEQRFLADLLFGEVRQGALDGVVSEAVARAAGAPVGELRRAAMLLGDLAAAAQIALHQGSLALAGVGLQVLVPVQPMLAATAADVGEAMASFGTASVEWKVDGVRIQVHRRGGEVLIVTRNLNVVTARFPSVVAQVLALDIDSVILDGELIGLREDDLPTMFQHTASSFASAAPEHGAVSFVLQAFYFDILHVDGEDLIARPLHERQRRLAEVVGEQRVPTLITNDVAEAERFAADTVARGHEGVMVKALDAPYEAGRRGKSWLKVKPVHTLDLIVVGVEWGHGRRRGMLSNLHLGALNPDGGAPIMVGKTFKGLTDDLLRWQTETFPPLAIERNEWMMTVRPEMVVEIAVDGVQVSTRYPGGVALRFARVRRYRPDKTTAQADSIDDVRRLLPRSAAPV